MPRSIDPRDAKRTATGSRRALKALAMGALVAGTPLTPAWAQQNQTAMGGGGVAPTIRRSEIRSVPGSASQPRPRSRFPQVVPPGPESFAVPPKTPLEFWDAGDYLVRSDQAAAAVPYFTQFLKSNPDDATLVEVRDTYGIGSILRLQDNPATQGLALQLLERLKRASARDANQPEKIARAISQLTGTADEQTVGLEQLRQAGAGAVPPLLKAIGEPGRSPEDRARLAECLGRLDGRAIPPLIAAMESPDPTIASDAANALGRLKDRRAVPALIYQASRAEAPPAVGDAARRAIQSLTGQPFGIYPKSPAQRLTDLAWQYHRGKVPFPSDVVELWSWQGDAPKATVVNRAEAASQLGMKLARQAVQLDPTDLDAKKALISLSLEHAARGPGGPDAVAAQDPDGSLAAALTAGPALLGDVLRTAIADGHSPLAQVVAQALGRVTNRETVAMPGRPDPLIGALSAPDRRIQYAAAEALINLDPPAGFAGSSRVVPVLARFVGAQAAAPRALVIDGSSSRGSVTAATLRNLGYDTQVASDGPEGFRMAADAADTEVILIDPLALHHWSWLDTITNLRADARTAGIPIFLTGPREIDDQLRPSFDRFPRVGFLYTPSDPVKLKPKLNRELAAMGVQPLSAAERQKYAQGAATLLARIAQPGSPYAKDLAAVEPELALALRNPAAQIPASNALSDVPKVEAQRSLADSLLDPGQPADLRRNAGSQLVRSIQRFGPLLQDSQERRLLEVLEFESDPAVRTELAAVLGVLQPTAATTTRRLRSINQAYSMPNTVVTPAEVPAPAGIPSEPTTAPGAGPAEGSAVIPPA